MSAAAVVWLKDTTLRCVSPPGLGGALRAGLILGLSQGHPAGWTNDPRLRLLPWENGTGSTLSHGNQDQDCRGYLPSPSLSLRSW